MKQKAISVEIRCDSVKLELQIQETDLQTGSIKGFKKSLSKVKTHCILRYVREEDSCHRIDIFTKKLAVKALKI
jgi:hypothetical protein